MYSQRALRPWPLALGWQFSPAFKGVLMKKFAWVALALVAAIGYSVNHAEARGGRGGGARGGGFRPGGNFGGGQNLGGQKLGGANLQHGAIRNNIGNGQLGKTQGLFGQHLPSAKSNVVGQAQGKVSQLQTNFTSKNEPFSPAWYADHPGAWQYTHPHADAWAVATVGATAAWLGLGAGYADGDEGTYYTSDDGTTSDDGSTGDEPVADNATQQNQQPDAAQLAALGAKDVPGDTEFLPLGVFALAPQGHQDATAVLQLSVTKDGILRGSYCDLISDQGQAVFGAVDKTSHRAAWTVGTGGRAVFDTTLDNLTRADGQVALEYPGGDVKQYTLARFENGNPTPDTQ
jgi:hypothetical protein